MKNIAHRGASGITGEDNTLKSFRTSWLMGCDMVEFDLRQTKCGAIVCFHDHEVNGISVTDLTHDELKSLTACDVPLFEATILECKDKIQLDIEIKETGFEAEALEILSKHLDKTAYTIKSFNSEVVNKVAEIDNSITRGLLLGGCKKGQEKEFIEKCSKSINNCNPHFLSPYYEIMEPWFLEHQQFQLPLFVWTVNEPDLMREMLKLNPAGIITDRPDLLAEIMKQKQCR